MNIAASPIAALNPRLPLNQVLAGDCRNVLRDFPDATFDMCLTDPPYLVAFKDREGRTINRDDPKDGFAWVEPAFAEIFRTLKPNSVCVSFYGWNRVDVFVPIWKRIGFRICGHVTFVKRYESGSGLVKYLHESAYILAKGSPQAPERPIEDVIDWGDATGNRLSPTEKPARILMPLISSFCPMGGVVLDAFAGSGSTLVAAALCGRHAIGIEEMPQQQAIASERIKRMRAQMLSTLGYAEGPGGVQAIRHIAELDAPALAAPPHMQPVANAAPMRPDAYQAGYSAPQHAPQHAPGAYPAPGYGPTPGAGYYSAPSGYAAASGGYVAAPGGGVIVPEGRRYG